LMMIKHRKATSKKKRIAGMNTHIMSIWLTQLFVPWLYDNDVKDYLLDSNEIDEKLLWKKYTLQTNFHL
jgi:hypothetical protein